MPTSLGAGLYCWCLIAWAVVHRNGALHLFLFFPPVAAFLPLFYLPISQMIPLFLSFASVFGGPCHFKKYSLSPELCLANPWTVPETQYYLAIRIMVEKVSVGSCVKHLKDDLVALGNLKIGILGLGFRHWLSSYSIIPNSSCFSSSMRIASHRRVWPYQSMSLITILSSLLQNFEIKAFMMLASQ